jgi:GAF domain-containing protein
MRLVTLMGKGRGMPRTDGGGLASPFLDLLPVTGAAISVFDQHRRAALIEATDATAARLEELQFDLSEGPSVDAFTTAAIVVVPDLAAADRWPAFLQSTADLGVGAVFAFPLLLGAACTGTVTCYRATPGGLDTEEPDIAALCRAIAAPAFRRAIVLADHEMPDDAAPIESRREIHQATGMVLTQLDITATDALSRLRAYAFSSGFTVQEIAHDVVDRRLNFAELPE